MASDEEIENMALSMTGIGLARGRRHVAEKLEEEGAGGLARAREAEEAFAEEMAAFARESAKSGKLLELLYFLTSAALSAMGTLAVVLAPMAEEEEIDLICSGADLSELFGEAGR